MKLEGERQLPGPPETVWTMLLDPDVLVTAIPGCEKLEKVGEDHYTGRIAAKVGSIQSVYDTTFKITDKDPPNQYTLKVEGDGQAGFVKATVDMRLKPAEGGDQTQMHYDADADVGGRIAQVGQRMVRATATALVDQGFNDLRDTMEARQAPESASASSSDARTGDASSAPSRSRSSTEPSLLKRLRRFLRTAAIFIKTLLSPAPEDDRTASSSQRSSSQNTRQAASEPSAEQKTKGMPSPPGSSKSEASSHSSSSSDAKAASEPSSEQKTKGMMPPPGSSKSKPSDPKPSK